MNEKNFSIFVVVFILFVAVFSVVFLFSAKGSTGLIVTDDFIYSGNKNGLNVFVYDNKIIAYNADNKYGTGFHYDSPLIQIPLTKKMGCPEDCYSIRHEDIQKMHKMGFVIDLYGDRIYACFCPKNNF